MSSEILNDRLQEARQLLANYNCAQALPAYEKLVRQFPFRSDVWLEFGSAARGADRLDLADKAWEKAAEVDPANTDLLVKIGHQYRDLRQAEKARAWYARAIEVEPAGSHPRIAMAMLLERDHRFVEARQEVDACLKADAKDEQGRYFEAFLDRRENKLEDAERRLRDLIAAEPKHQYVQYASRYELAAVLDRTGRYDEAMQQLAEAKELVRRLGDIGMMLQRYDHTAAHTLRATRELPKNILQAWGRQFPPGARKAVPSFAFLGGHPRSGTTLLEQILGAHPSVAAFDEPRAFRSVVCKLFNSSTQISPAVLNVIRRRYFDSLRREWNGSLDGKLIIDKNPAPTADLRVWLRVFPELRLVIALRDPRDVVLSCYFQNMLLNMYNANYLFLGRAAKRYGDLMEIWLAARQWTGLTFLETRYEDTVAALEKEGRRVTEFLGLTWDVAQERFHEKSSRSQIYAPTYHDASQPVYVRSVARWRAYEKHLEPILPLLEPYCQAFGYT
jgi:tetratricopeptide (TPR) repeat protein